jgi:hypothetical protein
MCEHTDTVEQGGACGGNITTARTEAFKHIWADKEIARAHYFAHVVVLKMHACMPRTVHSTMHMH